MITEKYSSFFEELAKNNHKEWFHANKKRYETEVKAPFLNLADQVLQSLVEWDGRIPGDVQKSMFRINRDIRFSKDKSPYNTLMKAGFAPQGRKSELPGYYLGIDSENVHVGGGLFKLNPSSLKRVRRHMALHPKEFFDLIQDQTFKAAFGRLKGDKSKRLDTDLLDHANQNEYLHNKQFYAFAEFPIANFYESDTLALEILEHFRAIQPLNAFLEQSLHT